MTETLSYSACHALDYAICTLPTLKIDLILITFVNSIMKPCLLLGLWFGLIIFRSMSGSQSWQLVLCRRTKKWVMIFLKIIPPLVDGEFAILYWIVETGMLKFTIDSGIQS